MRNILVTGANGQLGNELRIVTKGCTSGDRYFFTDVADATPESLAMLRKLAGNDVDASTRKLDITDLVAVRRFVKDNEITIIINCAAYTNVDAAEDNQELAELLNAKAVENLAVAMKEVQGLLIHISTDYVFGAELYNTPCREDQQGTPSGVYGLTKLHGEQAIQTVGCNHVIIRTAWLYSEFGKNFVKTMLNLTATKPQLKVVFDQVGTPTYAKDLAEVIFKIVDTRKGFSNQGIYHYSNEGVCSWYDFTKMIAEYAGHTECDIQPCHSDEFPSPVKRPAYSVLDKTKIKQVYGIKIPYWVHSLKNCINNLK
jgi:dTDP-4-dehydrorhamnose reductase